MKARTIALILAGWTLLALLFAAQLRDRCVVRRPVDQHVAGAGAEARFLRVHRSTIVNLDTVRQFLPAAHGDCELVLRDGTRLAASRTFSERLRAAARP